MSKKQVTLLVFGEGGHTAQMKRFIANNPEKEVEFVTLTNSKKQFPQVIDSFYCIEARHKFSRLKNLFVAVAYIINAFFQTIRIFHKYNVTGLISTGPGLAVIPAIMCRMLGKKVVYFESWSRFTKPSLAGRVMYKVASLFFVQHKGMLKFYPKSKYVGRL